MNNVIKYTLIPLAFAATILAEGCTVDITYTSNKSKDKTENANNKPVITNKPSKGKSSGLENKVAETPKVPCNPNQIPEQSEPYNNETIPEQQEQPYEQTESDLQIRRYRMPVRTEVLGTYTTRNPSFRQTTLPNNFDRAAYIMSFPEY